MIGAIDAALVRLTPTTQATTAASVKWRAALAETNMALKEELDLLQRVAAAVDKTAESTLKAQLADTLKTGPDKTGGSLKAQLEAIVEPAQALSGELEQVGRNAGQALAITEYALRKAGTGFNFLGVTLHMPFSVTRKVCELPLVPPTVRDACVRSFGLMNYLAASENRLFCSQLVLEAYRQAGAPITDADPRLISPADILHMREGDVPSVRIHQSLRYVGHLKYSRDAVATVAF